MNHLKRTALFDDHKKAGGRLIDFGGWELPVQYSGIIDEHTACRTACGIFDVSHMGEFSVSGQDSEAFLNFAFTNDVSKTFPGRAMYTVMCNDRGGIVDDLVIYRKSRESFLLIVNASNVGKDFAHLSTLLENNRSLFKKVSLADDSDQYSLIALQGRMAESILQKLTGLKLSEIKFYHFSEGPLGDSKSALISRTGYTGEDGFEIMVNWNEGPMLWRKLLEVGQENGLKPCGLGARDTLRTEMKYPLYGQELTDETSPLEAGLSWVVKLDKPDFVGKEAMLKLKAAGLKRSLVGIKPLERAIPRIHFKLGNQEHRIIGEITSGTHSPTLKEALGIGYVEKEFSKIGSRIKLEVRGQWVDAEVVETPFYKRPY